MKRTYSFSVIIWICRLMARKFQEMLPILISHSVYHINISLFCAYCPQIFTYWQLLMWLFFPFVSLFFSSLFVFWYIFLHVSEVKIGLKNFCQVFQKHLRVKIVILNGGVQSSTCWVAQERYKYSNMVLWKKLEF